tara:strand:- start:122 stop:460 length:339 start_codon:yes stop_codon:yes gene_type:complete
MNKIKEDKINKSRVLINNYRAMVNFYTDSYNYLLKNDKEFQACIVKLEFAGYMRIARGIKTFTYHSTQGQNFHIKFDLPKNINQKGEIIKSLVAIQALKNVENVIKKDHSLG